jgi:hypothetical protein
MRTVVVLALLALATRSGLRSDTDSVSDLEFLDVGALYFEQHGVSQVHPALFQFGTYDLNNRSDDFCRGVRCQSFCKRIHRSDHTVTGDDELGVSQRSPAAALRRNRIQRKSQNDQRGLVTYDGVVVGTTGLSGKPTSIRALHLSGASHRSLTPQHCQTKPLLISITDVDGLHQGNSRRRGR